MNPLIQPAQGIQPYPSIESHRNRGTSPLNLVYAGLANQSAFTTLSTTVDVLRAYAVVIGDGVAVDTLYVEATAIVANAVGRVGIYRNTADGTIYPSSLVVESGEVALATAVVRSASVSAPLSPGLYWLAVLCGTAAPTLRAIGAGAMRPLCGLSSALAIQFYYTVANAYAALPATFPESATFDVSNAMPVVGLHVA